MPALDTLRQDLRYSFRTLRRDSGFAAFAILIVGLVVEGLCLLSGSPIGFILFVGVGCLLIAIGILHYLYSLASSASSSVK